MKIKLNNLFKNEVVIFIPTIGFNWGEKELVAAWLFWAVSIEF